jgi:hypothetical protein
VELFRVDDVSIVGMEVRLPKLIYIYIYDKVPMRLECGS